ncbi:hypothetical protein BU23DRAFT_242011 [Bimuria novae-zelandiae CBS 107.79]|uniref:Uncharacterized protein n=1 Tax=Bimuria novae-zelandiae CBS 107.79 TaxID=1447943 RepID=A0A6A5UVV7_9PLEO|nr:hypothetical protein BU23DRAFT_242011 [Bimuria novae-zelandiae CBS 107.79]
MHGRSEYPIDTLHMFVLITESRKSVDKRFSAECTPASIVAVISPLFIVWPLTAANGENVSFERFLSLFFGCRISCRILSRPRAQDTSHSFPDHLPQRLFIVGGIPSTRLVLAFPSNMTGRMVGDYGGLVPWPYERRPRPLDMLKRLPDVYRTVDVALSGKYNSYRQAEATADLTDVANALVAKNDAIEAKEAAVEAEKRAIVAERARLEAERLAKKERDRIEAERNAEKNKSFDELLRGRPVAKETPKGDQRRAASFPRGPASRPSARVSVEVRHSRSARVPGRVRERRSPSVPRPRALLPSGGFAAPGGFPDSSGSSSDSGSRKRSRPPRDDDEQGNVRTRPRKRRRPDGPEDDWWLARTCPRLTLCLLPICHLGARREDSHI